MIAFDFINFLRTWRKAERMDDEFYDKKCEDSRGREHRRLIFPRGAMLSRETINMLQEKRNNDFEQGMKLTNYRRREVPLVDVCDLSTDIKGRLSRMSNVG